MIADEDGLDPASWRWTAADRLFLRLLDEAHARGLRAIIDGVFNHTGRDFFAFKDLRENQQDSPYAAWYVVTSWDDPSTPEDEFDHEGWWGYKPLPVFADNEDGSDLHPGPRQYILDATARWMDPNADGNPADGIDGWRLDVANEVPLGFWAEAPCSRTTGASSAYVASSRRCGAAPSTSSLPTTRCTRSPSVEHSMTMPSWS